MIRKWDLHPSRFTGLPPPVEFDTVPIAYQPAAHGWLWLGPQPVEAENQITDGPPDIPLTQSVVAVIIPEPDVNVPDALHMSSPQV